MGAKKVLEQFKKITTNERNIVQFIEGSYDQVKGEEIQNVILPYEFDWEKLKQKYLLNQIEKAKERKKLSIGINQVWTAATQNKGKLLIMETEYATSQPANGDESYYKMDFLCGIPFYIKDEVDELIEKVLESGGYVEFVEQATLKEYDHIVLIEKL